MKRNNKEKYIKSVSEFIKAIFSKIENFDGEDIIWFRGESSERYSLAPNLYRKTGNNGTHYCPDIVETREINRIEQNIDVSFYRRSTVYFANKRIEDTPWNRYFLKQHYGIKTRLLDWTENALFALFFAVNNRLIEENAKIWVLSPLNLNNYSVNKLCDTNKAFYKILTCGKLEAKGKDLINEYEELRVPELLRKYYRMDCNDNEKMYPLAIYPPHLDERMAAQQACFTLFGNVVKGLDCNDAQEKFLDCVYVDAKSKPNILKELRVLGISDYSIYPDLDGLGRTINYDHFDDINDGHLKNDLSSFFGNPNS